MTENKNYFNGVGTVDKVKVSTTKTDKNILKFRISMQNHYNEYATSIFCEAWPPVSDAKCDVLEDGMEVEIEGGIRVFSYEARGTGEKKYGTSINLDSLTILGESESEPEEEMEWDAEEEEEKELPF